MSLRTLTRALPRQLPSTTRTFSVAARKMAGGDTGAPRSGGAASGDAFTKREHASEELSIRQREKEKLEALKKKIADSEEQLAKDRKEVDDMNQQK